MAIIGGGPAGSSAAIRLRQRGFRVLLIEKDRFPRDKVCGEFLSPEVYSLMAELGLESELLDAAPARLHLVHLHLYGESSLDIALSRPALGLSRAVLDYLLLRRAAQLGAEVLQQTTADSVYHRPSGEFSIVCRRNGERKTALARAVICAAGRWSRWSPQVLVKPTRRARARMAYGFKAHYESSVAAANTLDLHFFPGGYCGVSHVEGGRANVCCLIEKLVLKEDVTAGDDPSSIILRQPSLAAQLLGATRVPEFLFTGPLIFGSPKPVYDSMCMIGDSAAFIDPFCGDGISIAMYSGLLAARALEPTLLGECSLDRALGEYARAYRRAFCRLFWWSALLRNLAGPSRAARWAAGIVRENDWLGQQLFRRTRPSAVRTAGLGLDDSLAGRHHPGI